MSSIAFHFPDVTLRIGGRERHWFNAYCNNIAEGLAKLRLPYGMKPSLGWTFGNRPRLLDTILNSVWATGAAPARLAAIIHGFCEPNLLIEGEAFTEVADAIDEGRRVGIFREETQGYDGIAKVSERFRQGGEWCALSYSVTDSFPRFNPETDECYTAEETVALIRKDGPTLAKGELLAQTFFIDGTTILTMTPDKLINLTSATKEF